MRHFSGELDGLRLLMADELDLIAGGDGEDTDENPQPPPTDLGTITVTANSTYFNLELGQLLHFYGTGQGVTGGAYNYYPGQPSDCRLTQIEFDASATANTNSQSQSQPLSNAIEQQSDRMRAIPDSLTVDHPNSTSPFTTGAELKSLWSKGDFVITGLPPQPGYGGSAVANNGNPVFTVFADNLPGYLLNDAREAWYFFHELAHVTHNGVLFNEAAHNAWLADPQGVPYEQSVHFAANERIMNTVAASLASLFGFDLKSAFPDVAHQYLSAGYEVSGTPSQLVPDTAGSGPGGTC